MRVIPACAVALTCALAWLASPLAGSTRASAASTAASPAAKSPAAAAPAQPPPITRIAIHGNGGNRVYDGVGAVLGGGGNARYLMDYPARQRNQILNYLFKPGYGAALQILKLEIGGDANSSDGSEPSIEHTRGHLNCHAGYELSIARQALARNKHLRLYGLQWTAPAWVRSKTSSKTTSHTTSRTSSRTKRQSKSRFTSRDISYLISWLHCASRRGLTIGYLGGWNEADTGHHRPWFHQLRRALNAHGYRHVQIIASDSSATRPWHYIGDRDVAILGTHDVCGTPTGVAGGRTACQSPWSAHQRATSGQPLWASELGGMDADARTGCLAPCAPAMDRAVVRGYVDARLTGFLEWPVLDAMPPGLPYENRGLVTADQPWSGSYQVNAMTWAIAQLTQVTQVARVTSAPGKGRRWRYLDSGSGLLRRGHPAAGSYVSLVRTGGSDWSTIIEATTATTARRAVFHVKGGRHLARRTVHVRASNFTGHAGSRTWFVRLKNIRPTHTGRFTLKIRPGWVYSLSTKGGQGKGHAKGRPAKSFPLPFTESLASSGRAGAADDEPPYLAAQDGALELAPCRVRDGRDQTCTEQEAVARPVFWHNRGAAPDTHYPYATIGDQSWQNYKVSVDVLLPGRRATAGLIGRFGCRTTTPDVGQFDGYVFDVSATGGWKLIRNANRAPGRAAAGCAGGPTTTRTLAAGTLARPLGTGAWHRLALSMSGSTITMSVGGAVVGTVSDATWTAGLAGIEAGAFTQKWPKVQYSHLSVRR
jgi:O-glycosyl hydrolase